MATSVQARPWQITAATVAAAAAYALGAVALAGEAAVHIQQYTSVVHGAEIGPWFLANAAASIAAIVALAYRPTRVLAALAGVVISVITLASLVVSYGRSGGIFGWVEAGFRTPIRLAVISELAAVVLLSTAIAATAVLAHARDDGPRSAQPAGRTREDERSGHRRFTWLGSGSERTA